ncbi:MAG: hypothetical protein AAFZ17_01335 [Cyanobacteria bacterium J06650_10]
MRQPIQIATGGGRFVSAAICTMTQAHVVQVKTIWQGILAAAEQPDEGWDWDYKRRLAAGDPRFEAYALEIDKLAQGVVLLETQWHRSQMDERFSAGEAAPSRLVYIEYLASAPWNRKRIEDPPYFVGVGRALLMFARKRSVALGYGGRVGLHALPGSEAFYHRQNMPDYGTDPDKEGLVYFEYGTLRQ